MFLKKDNFHEHFNRIFLLRFDFWVAKNVVWLEIVPKFQVFYKPIINFFILGEGVNLSILVQGQFLEKSL